MCVLHRYVNQPQPELQGSSVTLKATEERIQHMHREADHIWPPELAQLMKVSTECPHTSKLLLGYNVLGGYASHAS